MISLTGRLSLPPADQPRPPRWQQRVIPTRFRA